ncbi:MAG: SusD/RagB family nutrient-binding outer membrane lipoprotein [Flavisolibacter sp.]|nr:SusD/RagB family nutrient-binding outer membrane lipoprotein [Flavisolibacter sp.]
MTASEIQFIKAEAAFRKGDKQTAYNAYKEAISLHFDLLTSTYNANIPQGKEITATKKDAYLSNPAVVPPTPAGLTLSRIMLQKYIAMLGLVHWRPG